MTGTHSRLRWMMIALVFWATVINYLDRQTLSVVAPVLRDQLQMSNVTYSRVVLCLHARLHHHERRLRAVAGPPGRAPAGAMRSAWPGGQRQPSCTLWQRTPGPWASIASGGVKVVAEWFPERERASASGIFNSGSAVGAILAPPLVAWIVLRLGWPAAFVLVGASGFVWIVFWWSLYHTPAEVKEQVASPGIPAWKLLRMRFVWSFTLSKIFMDPVWHFYIFWFPEYLKRVRQFDMASIGKYAWIPFLVAGFGNLLGGWLSGVLLRRGVSLSVARKASVTCFAALMTSALPAVLVADVRLSIAMVSLAMVGYTGSLANMLAFPADVFPKNVVGSVYGLASMGSGFGGMVFTLMTGWVIDHYSYVPVFVGFGILPLICALILWTLLGPIRPLSAATA